MISGGEYAAVTGLQLGAIESANHFFSPCGVVKFLLEHGQSWKHCRCLTLDLGVPSLLDVLRCTAKISQYRLGKPQASETPILVAWFRGLMVAKNLLSAQLS